MGQEMMKGMLLAIPLMWTGFVFLAGILMEHPDSREAGVGICVLVGAFSPLLVWLLTILVFASESELERLRRRPFNDAADALTGLPRYRPLRGDEITTCD